MLTSGDQVTGLVAVRRGQQRQELVAVVSGGHGVLLEEPDGEGRFLFADASAQTRRDGECDAKYRGHHGRHFASTAVKLVVKAKLAPGRVAMITQHNVSRIPRPQLNRNLSSSQTFTHHPFALIHPKTSTPSQ